jgi:hypothetical protein
MCLKLTPEWEAEIVAIIYAFDNGGWEALQTAKTTASTLLHINQQSQLRTEEPHASSQLMEEPHAPLSPPSPVPSEISDLYLCDTEIGKQINIPIVVALPSALERPQPPATTQSMQVSHAIQKRKQDEQPAHGLLKKLAKVATVTQDVPSDHAGGSLERPKILRRTKKWFI